MLVLHVLRQVSLHVERQVVAAREAPFADFALEGLGARVLPVMPRQLVRPGELIVALGPLAGVRLLPCVDSLVRLQVGALGVHLIAAREVAVMSSSLL